jgi:hypothetical protein
MSDSFSVLLINGPFAEQQPSGRFEQYLRPVGVGVIRIPVNERIEVVNEGDAAFFAVYYMLQGATGDVRPFLFQHYVRFDGMPFTAEFRGGPYEGEHEVPQPAFSMHFVGVPLPSGPAEGGRLRRIADYRIMDGIFVYVKTHENVTTEPRVIFALNGGILEGRVFDSESNILDPEGAISARGWYAASNHGEIGKKLLAKDPYFWKVLEEFGEGQVPAYKSHIYELVSRSEENLEIRFRCEFRGIKT